MLTLRSALVHYSLSAQGITVVAAVAGTLLLTDKSAQQKASRERVHTNQLPADPTSTGALPSAALPPSSRTFASAPPASPPGLDLSSAPAAAATEPYSPGPRSARGKISTRALRQSGSMDAAQRDEAAGQHAPGGPMRASDFTRRLGEAERLQAEMDAGRKG